MSAGDDLLATMQAFVESGHKFVVSSFAPKDINPGAVVQVILSGPSGSHTVYAATVAQGAQEAIANAVAARLDPAPWPDWSSGKVRDDLKQTFSG